MNLEQKIIRLSKNVQSYDLKELEESIERKVDKNNILHTLKTKGGLNRISQQKVVEEDDTDTPPKQAA